MDVHLAHAERGLALARVRSISTWTSISHLKRLMALNTGDESLLERELGRAALTLRPGGMPKAL